MKSPLVQREFLTADKNHLRSGSHAYASTLSNFTLVCRRLCLHPISRNLNVSVSLSVVCLKSETNESHISLEAVVDFDIVISSWYGISCGVSSQRNARNEFTQAPANRNRAADSLSR